MELPSESLGGGRCPPYLYYASLDGLTTFFQRVGGCAASWPMVFAAKVVSTAIGGRLFAMDDGTNNNMVQVYHGGGGTIGVAVRVGGALELNMASVSAFGGAPVVVGAYIDPGGGIPQCYFNGVNETTYVTVPLVNLPVTTNLLFGARSTGNLMTGRLYRALVWPGCPAMSTAQADNLMARLYESQDWSWVGSAGNFPHRYEFYDNPEDIPTTLVADAGPHGWSVAGVANPPRVYHQDFYG